MTRLQIEFAKLQESRRAAQKSEELKSQELAETRRSNISHESIEMGKLGESRRHNIESESVERGKLGETSRSNKARETETNRANLAKEAENYRSNLARETETYRSNTTKETETSRANKAQEAIRIGEAATRAAQLAEQIRHDAVMESKDYAPRVTVGGSTTTVQNHPSTAKTGGQNSGGQQSNGWRGGGFSGSARSSESNDVTRSRKIGFDDLFSYQKEYGTRDGKPYSETNFNLFGLEGGKSNYG